MSSQSTIDAYKKLAAGLFEQAQKTANPLEKKLLIDAAIHWHGRAISAEALYGIQGGSCANADPN